MTERERLLYLIKQAEKDFSDAGKPILNIEEYVADYLLANGVTFERRWVSVAEQLPKTDGRFEVTIKGSKGKRYIAVCNYNKNANFDKWGNVNVIAWRERDKPYYGDREMN